MPMQNGYSESVKNRGTAHRMANGKLVREVISSAPYLEIVLEWNALTDASRDIIDAVVADLLDGSTGQFTPPTGRPAMTVVLGEELPEWEAFTIANGTQYRYKAKLYLEQNT
jgi:hypothetical protein